MEEKAFRGQWVQIRSTILNPGERSPQLPEDTRKVPLEMRTKGFLVDESARLDEEVTIRTMIGRQLCGTLVAVNPRFTHGFGSAVPELLAVGNELRERMHEKGN